MVRAITAGAIAFVVAICVAVLGVGRLTWDTPQAAGLIEPAMGGAWAGDAQIVVNWTTERSLRVRLDIAPDGTVSGTVGDATLRNGRLERNRTAIGRALRVKTDWIVRGSLDGHIIRTEGIRRDGV